MGRRRAHFALARFPPKNYEKSNTLVAGIMIDGTTITSDYEDWDKLEVAAFVGDECRSAYNCVNGESANYLYNGYVQEYGDPFPVLDGMHIYYNSEGGEEVTFKMYNHATEVEYTACTVTYQGEPISIKTGEDQDHSEGWFDPENPVFLNFTTPESTPATVTQTIALAAGENWFSTNLDVTLADLQAALMTATGGTASITINSQGSGSSTYVPGKTAWRGRLTTLDLSQMYMITVEADCEITLEGTPADPAEHSVTIKPGYNWIGMTMSGSITVANAFAGFAVSGDKVFSSSGTATYSGSRWRGSSPNTLEPGKGYIYYSAASEDKMLVFPTVE